MPVLRPASEWFRGLTSGERRGPRWLEIVLPLSLRRRRRDAGAADGPERPPR